MAATQAREWQALTRRPHEQNAKKPRKPRRSTAEPSRRNHSCHRSEWRIAGRHCFASYSRDARDAEGRVVGRQHERVRRRMTASAQRQVSAWSTLSQATKVPTAILVPISTSVSPVHSTCSSGRLVQLHLQAEHRKRHEMSAYRDDGGAESADLAHAGSKSRIFPHRCFNKMEMDTFLGVSVAIPERLRRTITTEPHGDRRRPGPRRGRTGEA